MAGELQGTYITGKTCYFLVRDKNANAANNATNTLEAYNSAHYSGYVVNGSEQGSSAYFVGNMPSWLPAGLYNVVMKQETGAGPVEGDPATDVGSVDWNGINVAQLVDISVSGFQNILLTRSWMVKNYHFDLRSSLDHISPLTSGTVSGQILRDNGAWGPLQSGAYIEAGFGTYALQALTSGDLNANTVSLRFTGVGPNGPSDPLTQHFILQRTSGY